jgi:predicted Zn-dependent peptidase
MKHQIHTLTNGLRVIFVDSGSFSSLTTLLLVGGGSRYENPDNNGVAHFFEHMAFKGSKKYPSSFIIASTVEGLGGAFNAFTSKDHTGYWIKALSEHFGTVSDVISDMVLNPLLKEEEVTREKGVIVEEINLYEDTPYRKVGDYFESLLYDGNPLGYDTAGRKETVTNFTRQTFLDYIGRLYHPKNAVLVVAGGTGKNNHDLDVIEEKLGGWNGLTAAGYEKVKDVQTKPGILVKYKKTEQSHFCLGFRAFSFFDPRKYALSVLSIMLGGGMSSRLFIEVRERRGLGYYISTGRSLYQDVGNLVTQAGVPNDIEKMKTAIEVILDEHKKISRGEIKADELKRAKELLKGQFLLSLEDSYNLASYFGNRLLLEGRVETPKELVKKIEAVTSDDIITVANDIFRPNKLNFSVIGPYEEAKEFEKVVNF